MVFDVIQSVCAVITTLSICGVATFILYRSMVQEAMMMEHMEKEKEEHEKWINSKKRQKKYGVTKDEILV